MLGDAVLVTPGRRLRMVHGHGAPAAAPAAELTALGDAVLVTPGRRLRATASDIAPLCSLVAAFQNPSSACAAPPVACLL